MQDKFAGDAQLINSVYLDNASAELYHGRLDKKPGALAVRIRWYGSQPPGIAFMERKTHKESWKVGGHAVMTGWVDAFSGMAAKAKEQNAQDCLLRVMAFFPSQPFLDLESVLPAIALFSSLPSLDLEMCPAYRCFQGEESVKERFTLPEDKVVAFLDGDYSLEQVRAAQPVCRRACVQLYLRTVKRRLLQLLPAGLQLWISTSLRSAPDMPFPLVFPYSAPK